MAASIAEVYGQNYQEESRLQSMQYSINILATNVSNLNLQLRYESPSLWDGQQLHPLAAQKLTERVSQLNPKYRMDRLTGQKLNMLPYLIDGPAEYFRIVDYQLGRIYLIYLTPTNMEAY